MCVAVKKDDLAERPNRVETWTRIEDYLGALLWRSRNRRRHREQPRTEVQDPGLLLNTLPFLGLILFLFVLVIAIAWLAWPGRQHPQPRPAAQREIGTAPPGWLERAKRDRG